MLELYKRLTTDIEDNLTIGTMTKLKSAVRDPPIEILRAVHMYVGKVRLVSRVFLPRLAMRKRTKFCFTVQAYIQHLVLRELVYTMYSISLRSESRSVFDSLTKKKHATGERKASDSSRLAAQV